MPSDSSGDIHQGYDRHVRLEQEDTWGTTPDSSWTAIPILGDGFGVKGERQLYQPNINVGGADTQVVIPDLQQPDGQMTTLPFPEVTQLLMDAALHREDDGDMYSYSAERYAPNDSIRLAGLVANTLTIQANGTGDGDVQIQIDWMGKSEESVTGLSDSDFEYSELTLVPFRFRDATYKTEDGTLYDIEEWSITVENNLREGPNHGGKRTFLLPRRRSISLELTKLAASDNYDQARREGLKPSFQATFVHPDGHTWSLNAPRCFVSQSADNAPADDTATTNPQLTVAKDPGEGYALQSTVDLGADAETEGDIAPTTSW